MDEQTPPPYSQPAPEPAFEPSQPPRPVAAIEEPSDGPRLTLADIYYTIFRHKWKILGLGATGIALAAAAFMYWPVSHASFAKIYIRGVQDATRIALLSSDVKTIDPDPYGEGVIGTEMEFLKSFNLAVRVAEKIGPERILNLPPEEVTLQKAAAVVFEGIAVSTTKPSKVVSIVFRHPNRDITQPVLQGLLQEYLVKRNEVYRRAGDYDTVLRNEADQRRLRLQQLEAEIQTLISGVGVLSIEEAKKTNTQQISKLQQDLMDAEANLAEKRAIAPELPAEAPVENTPTSTAAQPLVPAGVLADFQRLGLTIDGLRQREQDYLLQYTPESMVVRSVREQIRQAESRRTQMELQHPGLATARSGTAVAAEATGTSKNVQEAYAQIPAIVARIKTLREQLERTSAQATAVSNVDSALRELTRQKDLEEKNYRDVLGKLAAAQLDKTVNANNNTDIQIVEEPTTPIRETKQLYNTVYGLLAGGFILGLVLAFAIDLFLDQSVKRPQEVESSLGLPLFLSIPQMSKNARAGNGSATALLRGPDSPDAKAAGGESANLPATVGDGMRVFFEALRDRLVYYFEIRNLTRKPKLVAVTSCGKGAGVSTIAAGLAASLSETGDGNVLLVDMNPGQRAPHYFHKGDLKLGLTEALEQEKRPDALIREKLYMVSHTAGNNQLSRVLPTKFTHLVPKLKASDYEYIIFDMPPVGQLSVTPQLARYMDMTFMVVESEETNRDAVKRASAMLSEAGSKVAVVMNKTKNYLPRALQQESLHEA